MKVLDLRCALGHVFEGWFASESDFVAQTQNALVQCPVCGDPSVVKILSAPRLSLSSGRALNDQSRDSHALQDSSAVGSGMSSAWRALERELIANSSDVGERFAEEARKIHYGETEAHGLRGTATFDEARSLVEEGIEVLAFPRPMPIKGRLQ